MGTKKKSTDEANNKKVKDWIDITKPESQKKAEDRSVRLRNTWTDTEESNTSKDTEEVKQCQRKGRNGKTNDPRRQDKARGDGSEGDSKNEMMEGEWMLELAGARLLLAHANSSIHSPSIISFLLSPSDPSPRALSCFFG